MGASQIHRCPDPMPQYSYWRVWVENPACGRTVLWPQCFSCSQGGEGCGEASAHPGPEMPSLGFPAPQALRGAVACRRQSICSRDWRGWARGLQAGLLSRGLGGAVLRWHRPLCPARLREAEPRLPGGQRGHPQMWELYIPFTQMPGAGEPSRTGKRRKGDTVGWHGLHL